MEQQQTPGEPAERAVPPAVRAAVAAYRRPARPANPGVVQRGDLRRIEPADGIGDARLGLVVASGRDGAWQVTLIHPYMEMATGEDLVVPGVSAGTGFDVVIDGDLRGVVWEYQLGRLLGRIPDTVLEAYFTHGDAGGAAWRGPRLQGRLDARWDFKRSELDDLQRLCGPCWATLLDDLDP